MNTVPGVRLRRLLTWTRSGLDWMGTLGAGLYLAVAVVAGATAMAPVDTVLLSLVASTMSVMVVLCVSSVREAAGTEGRGLGLRVYLRSAGLAAVGMVVLVGAVRIGWGFTLVGMVLLAGALAARSPWISRRGCPPGSVPPVVRCSSTSAVGRGGGESRLERDLPVPQPPDVSGAGVPPEVRLTVSDTVTDLDLCRAWRSSYVALVRARTDATRAQIARTRAVLLEELERRHPEGVRQWLRAGARAASGPERFLHGVDHGRADPRPTDDGRTDQRRVDDHRADGRLAPGSVPQQRRPQDVPPPGAA